MTDQDVSGDGERYRSVLASLPVLVSTHTVDGTYTGIYTALQVKSTGTPEELVGSALEDVLNDEATKELLSCAEATLETGERQYVEFPVYFAGEEFRRGAYVSPLAGTDEVVIVSFDLTRHHEREEILYDTLEALVTNTSRRALERTFCEKLVEKSRYRMAWIGGYGEDGVEVQASAGTDGYLEEIAERFGSLDESNEPGVCAARSRQPTGGFFVDESDGWAEVASKRGLQAGVALPLSHGGVDHGVLVVYTTDSEYLAPWREEVLESYADAVGYALSAAMWRWALTAETAAVVSIEFSGGDLSALCAAAGCGSLGVESVVPRPDGTVYYLESDDEVDLYDAVEATESMRPYGDGPDGVHAVVLEEKTPERRITQMGTRIRGYHVTPERASLTVVVPNSEGVRPVMRRVRDRYADASISVGWGEQDAENRLAATPETVLTDRQHEVLEAAYRHGYFESNSDCNLTDLAEVLGISRWTVSQHLRAAQKKLCSHMFE